MESDGNSSRELTVRVRVQSDAGVKQAGVLTFAYESLSSAIEIPYVRVRKPDGSVVNTPTENILDMPAQITREAPFYSDLHEKQVAVKGLSQGDVVEYQCRWQTTKALIAGQFWTNYSFAADSVVLNEELDIRVPSQRLIKLKSPTLKPETSEKDGYKTYHWKSSRPENKKKEENGEGIWEMAKGRLPQPDVRLTSFRSWEEIGRWYGNLQQERVKPSAEVQAKAAELTKGLTTDDEKIHALYNFVSTRFRYIGVAFGIGRYQPHAAEDVLDNQYGDCKDKHTLFASLLAAAGIKAYPALISSSHDLDSDAPTPSQFDHVITAVPRGGEYLWLDTTPEVAPFGLLMPGLREKHALVIPEGAAAVIATTPKTPPYKTNYEFLVDGKLGDDGVLKAKVRQTNRSDAEVLFRSGFRRVPQAQWKDLVQSVSRSMGFGGTVDDVEVSAPENLADPFHFSYSYDRKDYSDWANHRITPPLPPIPASDYGDEVKKLTAPIPLGAPGDFIYRAKVELPHGYDPTLPSDVTLKPGFAEYHATYEVKDHVLIAERRLTVESSEVPPEKYEAYKAFVKAIFEDENHYIVFGSSSVNGPRHVNSLNNGFDDLPESGNPDVRRLVAEAGDSFRRQDNKEVKEKLERALAIEPNSARILTMLGATYLRSDQREQGLRLYQQALEANPKEPYIYKILGAALENAKKYDAEAKLWKEYSQNFPEDGDGIANVAGALYHLKLYSEAASDYAAAFKLNDKDEYLPQQMGNALAKAGEKDKALLAFHKAIDINSSSSTLNNVGYDMADNNLDLAQALEYARKAVSLASEESSKIDINRLTTNDLSPTANLVMYWDTLGWVYFRMDKLDLAEKYVKASWKVEHIAEVGEHLGEIYQKQGNKEAAVFVFRLALEAISPSDGDNDVADTIKRHISELEQAGAKVQTEHAELNGLSAFKLERIVEDQASADFFLELSPGGKIEQVKFISGSEKLKIATDNLAKLKIADAFPDATPARLLRRGILGCYPTSGCSLVLLSPRYVQTVN